MQNAIVIKGRLVGSRKVELDEPAPNTQGEVEVIVRTGNGAESNQGESIFEFLRHLPAGTRSRDEIDRQIRQEHEDWEDGR
ncbi:MAG TPA: hypothetical protein VHX86_20330 [Tepidisphaeraceae bacterium]|jgi:hypothetical protein|nr:hypothetical protein [Tepidisphaeraceae bacterium]